MTTVGVLLALVSIALCIEMLIVRRSVLRLRVRVHVGGTRGKSSVVRYVTAAMRRSGYRVIGKVTGEVPTLILPDGQLQQLKRRGPARVQEQMRVIRMARKHSCDAIVLECMSLNPLLQTLESRVLRPTISVLTNILDDHREEFGSSPSEQAEAVCAFLPWNAPLIANEDRFADLVASLAILKNARVIRPDRTLPAQFASHPEAVHVENVMLALAVCDELEIDRDEAVGAIVEEISATPSPLITCGRSGSSLRFLNGFTVNDVPSARRFLEYWIPSADHEGTLAVILNTRADRPIRSIQFARWCATLPNVERIVLTGTHRERTRRELLAAGVDRSRITAWSADEVRDPVGALQKARLSEGCLVIGLGNIGGDGFAILEGIQQWS